MAGAQVFRLSDGREFRALPGKYHQADTFDLARRGLWDPQTEGIATVKQLDDAINIARVYQAVIGSRQTRSGEVGFYRKGFESALLEMGTRLVWVEKENSSIPNYWNGRIIVATLDLSKISDEIVRLPDGSETILRRAIGMGVIPLSRFIIRKIEDDIFLTAYEVIISSDFDPKTDLTFKNVGRPRCWSTLVDADGYPLNEPRLRSVNPRSYERARFSSIRHSEDFLDPNSLSNFFQRRLAMMGIKPEDIGWFGSVARHVNYCGGFNDYNRCIVAGSDWSLDYTVPLVSRNPVISNGNLLVV